MERGESAHVNSFAFSEEHFVLMGADVFEAYLKQLSSFFYATGYCRAVFISF